VSEAGPRRVHLRGGPEDDAVSLLIDASGPGVPRVLHLGAAFEDGPLAPEPQLAWGARLGEPVGLSLLPTEGRGFFGEPALILQPAGAAFLDLRLTGAQIGGDEAAFTLTDGGLTFRLILSIDPETGVVVSRAAVDTDTPVELRWLAAACWPLPDRASEVLTLTGDWADEFRTTRAPCPPGLFESGSRRGRSSHQAYPGLVVGEAGFGEDRGEVWAATLGWSGDHRLLTEPLDDGGRQLQLGERLGAGEVVLQPGERWTTPPAYTAFSRRGLNGLRGKLHGFARRGSCPGGDRATPAGDAEHLGGDVLRPGRGEGDRAGRERGGVGRRTVRLGRRVVQGARRRPRALGDWTVDPGKYPRGLLPVAERVVALGMQFGLWVEPEMVNPDSDLARAHPEWVLTDAGRTPLPARQQWSLDLTQPAVANHLFDVLDRLLRELPIGYLKWDMNRPLTDAATRAGDRPRPAQHAYVAALHGLIDRVRASHPDVEIEACASGGGRADWGMLARSERVWTSDNLDPLDRLRIQRGASLVLPPEVMGAHVGAAKAHITGRTTGLNFRAHVATFGAFGVEASPGEMDEAERIALTAHIAQHKRLRPLLHGGRQVWLETDADHAALLAVAEDRSRAVMGLYRTGSGEGRAPDDGAAAPPDTRGDVFAACAGAGGPQRRAVLACR
jgi:alpha-galactosidase